jgi:membrane protein DedA with SNARE-associated domain/rhodanese-related sulfurtransferase
MSPDCGALQSTADLPQSSVRRLAGAAQAMTPPCATHHRMQAIFTLIEQYGLALVFANVLLLQLGLPLPAYPTLITIGALAAAGRYSPALVIGVAVIASLMADLVWYFVGHRVGRRALSLMCRLSLSPDSCVRQSESIYERFGPPSLLLAKFIPGYAAIATAMAGIVRTQRVSFVLFDALGATLWAGVGVALGWTFRDAVAEVLAVLEQAGRVGLLLLASALALFISAKAWQRYQFRQQLKHPRISVEELNDMIAAGQRPLVIDVRMASSHAESRIPGALWIDSKAVESGARELPASDEVIVYCACPNEASAVLVARQLMNHGFSRVRALHGGIDAWTSAGYAVEGPDPLDRRSRAAA